MRGPLSTRILSSTSQFPTIRVRQQEEEVLFSSYRWNVLVDPTFTYLLGLKCNLRLYIGQQASDEPGQGNTVQWGGPPFEHKCWKGMMSSMVIFSCSQWWAENRVAVVHPVSDSCKTPQYSCVNTTILSFPPASLSLKLWPHPGFVPNSELATSNFTLWLLFLLIGLLKF